jgi:hypothetical protein
MGMFKAIIFAKQFSSVQFSSVVDSLNSQLNLKVSRLQALYKTHFFKHGFPNLRRNATKMSVW